MCGLRTVAVCVHVSNDAEDVEPPTLSYVTRSFVNYSRFVLFEMI